MGAMATLELVRIFAVSVFAPMPLESKRYSALAFHAHLRVNATGDQTEQDGGAIESGESCGKNSMHFLPSPLHEVLDRCKSCAIKCKWCPLTQSCLPTARWKMWKTGCPTRV